MTTKEWLSRGRRIDERIKELEAEKQAAFEQAISTVGHPQPDKVQTSSGNKSEEQMVKYAHYAELIDNKLNELITVRAEIIEAIYSVPDPILSELLFLRYIKHMKWEEIAERMGYNYYHVRKFLHKKALNFINIPHNTPL